MRTDHMPHRLVAAGAITVVVLLASTADADPTVTGDQDAWRELVAAFQRLAASSYRVSGTIALTQGTRAAGFDVSMDVAPPDKLHVTMRTREAGGPNGLEVVAVGDDSRFRLLSEASGAGPWRCNPIRPDPSSGAAAPPSNWLVAGQGTREVNRGLDSEIHGAQTHAYYVTGSGPDPMRSDRTVTYDPGTTVFIDAQTQLPVRVVTHYTSSTGLSGTTTMDFHDYGAPIVIDLPSCD